MSVKIVKPYDWEFIRTKRLDIVVEGVDQPGFTARLYSYDGYFRVAPSGRVPLARHDLDVRPGGVAHAVIPELGPWGPSVISIVDPSGQEVTASGVKFGRSETSNWLSGVTRGGGQGAEPPGIRYPLRLASSSVSHTPADAQPTLALLSSVQALCEQAPSGTSALVGAAALSQATAYNGLDALSLPHSLGKDDPAFSAMLDHASWTSIVPYVARFHGAVAQIPSGLVLFDGLLWSDSTVTAFFNDPELRQHTALFRAHEEVGTVGGAMSGSEILVANGLDRFPGIPLLVTNAGYRNHAHWIMNTMLAAYYCRDMILSGRVCVLIPEYSDYAFASLMSLGIRRESILVAPPGFYRFEDVLFPSTLSTHVNRAPPPEIGAMFNLIRAHCLARVASKGPRLVYFTRQGSGAARRIRNEDALIAALKDRGFVCIAPHELTFEEEVSCVADAALIVGQLGAALMNIAFAPRSAWVVELASHNYTSYDYWILATTLGQRFVRVLARAESDEALTLTDFSFEIPLAATLASIDRILATLDPGVGQTS